MRELPSARELPGASAGFGGVAGFVPESAPVDHGVAYRFRLGHCGLHWLVDVDGSFWDAVDGVTATGVALDLESDPEMINATSGVIVVTGDEMSFTTDSGKVVRFRRHHGLPRDVGICL